MQLVKHSLQLARRHNQSFQLNTDRRLNRERIYPLPVFWQTTKDLLFDIELCSAKHVSRHGINRKLKISTCKIKNFGLTNRGHMVYPFWEVKRETRKTVKILFALHYIQQNARSTVQTEQAMLFGIENIYRRHGAGPQEAAADMDLNVIAKNLHSRNMRWSRMWLCFQTYLRDSVCFAGMSFLLQNMDGTEGRSWDIPIQKRKNTGGKSHCSE